MSLPQAPQSIGVIISTYNAAPFLRLTLAGYARQTHRDFSIYIADDGSGPEIAGVIEDFRQSSNIRIQHFWHEDKGYRRAGIINRALAAVDEPYILLTDADCVPLPALLSTHLRLAEPGMFMRGSRVMLTQGITEQLAARGEWNPDMGRMQWLRWRLAGHINRLLPIFTPPHTSQAGTKLYGIRGCHFSFWHEDILKVNGFDASYEGWGREDSDLAARLFHAGVMRKNLYGMPVLHLWHKEASRNRLAGNDVILQECLDSKRVRARVGIAELDSA